MAFAWSKAPAGRAGEAASELELNSPGLRLISERLATPGKHEILELGAARGPNLDYLSDFRCRVQVEDVYDALKDFPRDDPYADPAIIAKERARQLDQAICCDAKLVFDIVLGWDLVYYLPPEALTGLMERVAARSRPGTLLYLLLSNGGSMTAEPASLTMRPDHRIRVEPTGSAMVPCPAYPPLTLERMMPGFRLLHSNFLGGSMQDYLFSFRA